MLLVVASLALVVLLVRFYPLPFLHLLDRLEAFLEERDRRKRERFLVELHEKIVSMKAHIAEADVSPESRAELQDMCDEYEIALRAEVFRKAQEV